MRLPRSSGVLMHVTSLPSRYGFGDFGPAAYAFVDWLEQAGQTLWQVLPLHPTGYGNSPYQSLSAFAGNPMLVSLDRLVDDGWLDESHLVIDDVFADKQVDFQRAIPWRRARLVQAAEKFQQQASDSQRAELAAFYEENKYWLDEYALFVALKELHEEALWTHWQRNFVHRKPATISDAQTRLAERIRVEVFTQFQFDRQWKSLKRYANERNIRLMGDMPIFVSHDSADVWAHQEQFAVDEDGWPKVVAGVPPDYFSATGQLWGNPLYRWEAMAESGYRWWTDRMRHAQSMFDLIRLDHFRGFEAYWEVPGDAPDASHGRWVPGPGLAFFEALREQLGELKIVAEDLGVITPPVEALRDAIGAPGMRVLQFAFSTTSKARDYRPHNFIPHTIVYTGTHDNDTTYGWFHSEAGSSSTRTTAQIEKEQREILEYLGTSSADEIHWKMIRLALASVADTAVIPMQDLLGLGTQARMNLPGTASGNWAWRLTVGQITPELTTRLRRLTEVYERLAKQYVQ